MIGQVSEPQVLELDIGNAVAQGVQRSVHAHPVIKSQLIKVLRPEETRARRNDFNGIVDRWVPSTRIRQIRKEYHEYLRHMLTLPEPNFQVPISHMFGFVQTSLGLGCITERVFGPDDRLGETLAARSKSGRLTQADVDLLNDTIARIFASNLRASDLNPSNFVFGSRVCGDKLGPRECVLVDGFGDTHAVPIRSLSKWTNRRAMQSTCRRLARNAGLQFDSSTLIFSTGAK